MKPFKVLKKICLGALFLMSTYAEAQISIIQADSMSVEILPNGIRGGLPARASDTTNIAIGKNALLSNQSSRRHIAIGTNALKSYNLPQHEFFDPDASSQIAIGYGALAKLNPSSEKPNIAIGAKAMGNVNYFDAGNNIALGQMNMQNGIHNGVISIGNYALMGYTGSFWSSSESIFIGNRIGIIRAEGSQNTIVGHHAFRNSSGDYNTILGFEAGMNLGELTRSNGNIFLGYQAGKNELGSNKLYIENSDSLNTLIGGDFATNRVGINRTTAQVSATNRTFQVEESNYLSFVF